MRIGRRPACRLEEGRGRTQSLTFLALLLPFLGAVAAPLLCRVLGAQGGLAAGGHTALIFVHSAASSDTVAEGRPVAGGYDWIPSLGVRFSWYWTACR